MKIDDLSITLFGWNDIPPHSYLGRGPFDPTGKPNQVGELALVTIRTDEGIEGHSFLGMGASVAAQPLLRMLKPVVMGRDPLAREQLYHAMLERRLVVQPWVVGAVDVALWDIAGKAAGEPIHRLLGTYREKLPAYASSEQQPSVEAYVEQALSYQGNGWQGYKIHPFRVWRDDMRIVEAVREAVGDGFPLMLDSTWGYDYPQALRVGKTIEELDFEWYEDPLGDQDLYNYTKLRQQLRIPIMATEFPGAWYDSFAPWIYNRATDYLRGDVALKGGITGCLKAAHLAEGFGMNFEIHHGGNSLNNVAHLHLSAAIRNCEWFEVLLPAGAQKYGLVEDIEVDAEGYVHAPMGPGLGVEIDFDLIERNKTAELR